MSPVWAVVAVVWMSAGWLIDPAQGGGKASIGGSGEFVELSHEVMDGPWLIVFLSTGRAVPVISAPESVSKSARQSTRRSRLRLCLRPAASRFSPVSRWLFNRLKEARRSPFHGNRSMARGCSWICRRGYTTSPPPMATKYRF